MKNIRLSFIVPCYKAEQYIERCITSLVRQDIPESEYEIICVNDCSPDNTRDRIVEIKKVYKNIILIDHEVNKGPGCARNTGLRSAKGNYIWFVDSDDSITENILEETMLKLENNKLDIITFNFYDQKKNGDYVRETANYIHIENVIDGETFLRDNFTAIVLSPWSKIFKKKFLEQYNLFFEEGVFWEDADYIIKAIYLAKKILVIPDYLYYYTYNENAITKTHSGKKYADLVKVGARKLIFYEEIKNKSPEIAQLLYNDALWNATIVRRILYLSVKERNIFYALLKSEEFESIKKAVKSKKLKFLYKYPHLVNISLFLISPLILWSRKLLKIIMRSN